MTGFLSALVGWGMQHSDFDVQTIDPNVEDGYQTTVADLDSDGRDDILTLGKTVSWLRSPNWEKRPITGDQTSHNIDLAPHDIDGDGELEVVVASDFSMDHGARGGIVQWFRRGSDLSAPWIGSTIDSESTSHRIRWADIEGSGKKLLVNAPIMGPGSKAPDYGQAGARLFIYRIPDDPLHQPWPKQLIDDSLPILHGLLVFDWNGDGRDELLTASRLGVHLFQFTGSGSSLSWTKLKICGNVQEGSGASEVRVGHLRSGRRFIATIEPWHGPGIVVYEQQQEAWLRTVIDRSFSEGHALWTADLDGDGSDEIYAGYRGNPCGVTRYQSTGLEGNTWHRTILDAGKIACQGFALHRSSKGPALLAVGGRTHNLLSFRFGDLR